METVLKTAPASYPITLDEGKRQTRIPIDDNNHDVEVADLIKVATSFIEELTHRKLFTQTWYAYFDRWPGKKYFELPFGSLQSVTAVKYTDVDDSQSAWSSDEYIVGTDYLKGRITLADGYTWPNETLYPSNPIEIEFVCGYGAAADVPELLKHAIKMYLAEIYENREISIVGTTAEEMPQFNNIVAQYGLSGL